MLRTIKFLIKTAVFAALVLILGNYFQWRGKTVSDQVKTEIAHAEKSEIVTSVKDWTHHVHHQVSKEISHEFKRKKSALSSEVSVPQTQSAHEEISSTEQQRLRALIRDLNYNTN